MSECGNKMIDLDDNTLDVFDKSSSRIHGVNNAMRGWKWEGWRRNRVSVLYGECESVCSWELIGWKWWENMLRGVNRQRRGERDDKIRLQQMALVLWFRSVYNNNNNYYNNHYTYLLFFCNNNNNNLYYLSMNNVFMSNQG